MILGTIKISVYFLEYLIFKARSKYLKINMVFRRSIILAFHRKEVAEMEFLKVVTPKRWFLWLVLTCKVAPQAGHLSLPCKLLGSCLAPALLGS